MIWVLFSFLTALFESLKDVFSKKSLSYIDEYIVSFALRLFALPFLIPLLFFIDIPYLGNKFWLALFVSGMLNIIATILYMKAIKYSDLSSTVPMVTFTPLFLLLTAPLFVGEVPSIFGLIGVVFIVFGAYTLNIKQMHKGFLAPFKALFKETGPKLMLLVALVWSISSNFDKIGVQNSSSIFWAIAVNIFIVLTMFPIMLYKSQKSIKQIFINHKMLFPIGLFSALVSLCQMKAISLALVAYVISIKRTSVIMSVLFGYLLFKEKKIKEKLVGAMIMLVGVVFITLLN